MFLLVVCSHFSIHALEPVLQHITSNCSCIMFAWKKTKNRRLHGEVVNGNRQMKPGWCATEERMSGRGIARWCFVEMERGKIRSCILLGSTSDRVDYQVDYPQNIWWTDSCISEWLLVPLLGPTVGCLGRRVIANK